MSNLTQQVADMLDMLPETEQQLAYEMMKRIVLAWDTDYTKVTKQEAAALKQAEREIENGETVSFDCIDW